MNKRSLLAVLLVFMLVFSSFAVYADEHMEDENGAEAEAEVEVVVNGDDDADENDEAVENDDEETADEDEAVEEDEMDEETDVDEEEEEDEEMEEEVDEVVAAQKIQLQLGNEIAIIDDATHVTMDLAPFVDENNRTLVPFRFLSEQLGAGVAWNEEDRTVTYETEEMTMVLTIDSSVAMINGEEVELDSAPVIDADSARTVVPLRFVSEQMGYEVDWNEATRIIVISAPVEEEAVEEEEVVEEDEEAEEDAEEEEEADDEATEEDEDNEEVVEEDDEDEEDEEDEE